MINTVIFLTDKNRNINKLIKYLFTQYKNILIGIYTTYTHILV